MKEEFKKGTSKKEMEGFLSKKYREGLYRNILDQTPEPVLAKKYKKTHIALLVLIILGAASKIPLVFEFGMNVFLTIGLHPILLILNFYVIYIVWHYQKSGYILTIVQV